MGTSRFLVCVLLASNLIAGICQGQQPPDSMVVVLTNYGVILGQITSTAEGINVRTNSGSTAVLRLDQVACLAESFDSAYEQLLAAADPADIQEVGRLFDWCLRNGLGQRAAELLSFGESKNLDPAALQLLRRRLDSFETAAQGALNQTWPSHVEQAVEKPPVTQKEIDNVIKSLPNGAEAIFNQQLHSKLVIGCAAAKCHSRDSETMALWHHGKGIASPRGLTRRNLHQVMQFVNQDDPKTSKVLEMALTAHGGQSKPSLERSSTTFQLLQNWTYAVSRHPENYWTEVVQSTNPNPQGLAKSSDIETPAQHQGVISQVGFVESSSSPTAPPQTAGQPAAVELLPTDPCDPIIFNRRHHPERVQ